VVSIGSPVVVCGGSPDVATVVAETVVLSDVVVVMATTERPVVMPTVELGVVVAMATVVRDADVVGVTSAG